MSSAIYYQSVFYLNNGRLRIYHQAKDALYKAGIISSNLKDSDLSMGLQYLGEKEDYLIFAMVAKCGGKYYCFNSYPERNGVALVYILDKIENGCMVLKVNESLASLRRLHGSRT